MSDDVAKAFEDQSDRTERHPVAVFFHLAFRVTALVVYLLANFIPSMSEMGVMISIILLLALDFWTVKNVTGRILAGLRWWNKIEEDGSSSWVFEWRKEKQNRVPASETYIFWIGLFACPIIWIVFLFTSFVGLKFTWMMLTVVGIVLNGANVVGYVQCRRDAGTKFSSMATKYIGKKIIEQSVKGDGFS